MIFPCGNDEPSARRRSSKQQTNSVRKRRSTRWGVLVPAVVLGWIPPLGAAADPDTRVALIAAGSGVSEPTARAARRLEDGRWEFQAAHANHVLAPREFVVWGAPRENVHAGQVVLRGGGVLVADWLRIDAIGIAIGVHPRSLAAEPIWRDAVLPRGEVAGLIVHSSADPASRDRVWNDLLEGERAQDEIRLDNGDRILGEIDDWTAPNGLRDGTTLRFKTEGEPLDIGWNRVEAVLFRGAPRTEPSNAAVVLGFRDGSLFRAESLAVDGPRIRLIGGGIELSADAESLWTNVCHVRSLVAPVRYLSDLESVGFKHIPMLNREWPFERDRSAARGRLRSKERGGPSSAPIDVWHEKGLGLHATSRVAYDVPDGAARLDASIGVDSGSGDEGSVIFRVYGETESGEFQLAFESPIVRAGEPPRPISVPLARFRRLALIADSADRLDIGDHADWLLARFVMAP